MNANHFGLENAGENENHKNLIARIKLTVKVVAKMRLDAQLEGLFSLDDIG